MIGVVFIAPRVFRVNNGSSYGLVEPFPGHPSHLFLLVGLVCPALSVRHETRGFSPLCGLTTAYLSQPDNSSDMA